VIHNLVINAKQAMPGGGTVRIAAQNFERSLGVGLTTPRRRYVRITVEDHGAGIPREHLAKVFDPFFTTKPKGSGLGLSTSYSIVKNHGGHIGVESDPGVATTFTLLLPAATGRPAAVEARPERPAGGHGRILFMDDEAPIRAFAAEALGSFGYEVECAADGLEAIERCRAARQAGRGFDLAILDLTVPGGMGGGEAIKRLREIEPHLSAVVSSGYFEDPVLAEFREHGFQGAIAKPYAVESLQETVARVLAATLPAARAAGGATKAR
jgi:CheY-like chemotaxis protein